LNSEIEKHAEGLFLKLNEKIKFWYHIWLCLYLI
jgi:hypothetical protein